MDKKSKEWLKCFARAHDIKEEEAIPKLIEIYRAWSDYFFGGTFHYKDGKMYYERDKKHPSIHCKCKKCKGITDLQIL